MLDRIKIENFTVFDDIEFQFGKGVNVIIGDNGTGKSHLLKLAYAISTVAVTAGKQESAPAKADLQRQIAAKLVNVFRPDALGRLVRSKRAKGDGESRGNRGRATVQLHFFGDADQWSFNFSGMAEKEVALASTPKVFQTSEAIFIPTKEMMSMFPGFASLYRNRELSMDETYFDLCLALDGTPLRGPRLESIKQLLGPIEERLGGQVVRDGDKFYLDSDKGKTEMPLVAEGVRKLATLAHLLRNGALTKKGIVFWDEPESNLNPRLIRDVAAMLMSLASQGLQVFIGTHSFFLMKEIDMLKRMDERFSQVPCRYITLSHSEDGEPVFEQGDRLKDVSQIVALEQELAQYDRELSGAVQ
jgi:energy-coupling factor transporter ATP-binding protein EcfA2